MNKSAFLRLIRNASSITSQEADELEELVVNFPYCQTAHLLIAKSAYDRGSMLSNQKLRKAASYATNRQVLKKLIYTTAADVSLKEVAVPEQEEPAAVASSMEPAPVAEPAKEPVSEEETAPISAHPELDEKEPEGRQQVEESFYSPAEVAGESPAEEVPFGKITLEEVVDSEAEEPMPEAAAEEQPEADAPVREEEPQMIGRLQEPFPEEEAVAEPLAENEREPKSAAAEDEDKGEDLPDELAELLYIDRIMPYRHLLPESSETLQQEQEEEEPILLEQFANPTLTEEEVAALEALVQPEEEQPEEQEEEAEPAPEEVEGPAAEWQPEYGEEDPGEREPAPELAERTEEETLSRFDAFLFHPERDAPEPQPTGEEESVTATYPADVIDQIYTQNQLGYWMNSSRLGESLELKNELTTAYPCYFHPELILEYVQVNEVEKQIRPADSPLNHQLDLIDQFLKLNPRLKQFADAKVKPEPQEDLSFKSSKIKKSLASENLANIFLKQGKIKKAIKIYEHLIVKIPEKKAYFADQILKLKNLT